MAYDDEDIGDDDQPASGGFASRPLLIGLIAGIIAFFAIAFLMPHDAAQETEAQVAVEAPAIETPTPTAEAQVNETPAEEAETAAAPEPEAEDPPAASVPIVAEAAVVILNTGLNRRVTSAVDAQMPREITLAISPYATDPAGTAAAFKASGRDVWLQIAAQSVEGGIDPGPLAVAGSMPPKENAELISRQIALAGDSNIVGVFVPDDSDITLDQAKWREIAEGLIARNHMILDATDAKVATSLYLANGSNEISAYLKATATVSGADGPSALKAALEGTVPAILKQQEAIVVVRGLTTPSIEVLSAWIKGLAAQGIRLVPASKFTGLKG